MDSVLLFGYCALLLVAAAVDAASRRYPNALALAIAVLGISCSISRDGVLAAASRLLAALGCAALLALFELAWRRSHRGTPGMGMGDVKALVGFMVVSPSAGLAGFASGLLLLAAAGSLAKKPSLPLLPFAVPSFLLALAAGAGTGAPLWA